MIGRREFIAGALASSAVVAAGAGPAVGQGVRKRTIVDAQVHLWKASGPDYPWRPGAEPQLPEPFTIERALPLMDAAGIDRAIVVPPTLNDVNSYAIEAARRYPSRFAIMGRIPIEDPKTADLLPKWKAQPGMLGIRVTFINDRHMALFDAGNVDWFWAAAEKANIPVYFMAPGRLPKFTAIAERHPGLPLIIDHMGLTSGQAKAGRTNEVIGHVVALAKYPNVSVKISNVPSASQESYPFSKFNEHIKRVFEAYGPQRCYWGTDITNQLAQSDWSQRLRHVTDELKFLTEADKDWLLGRGLMQRLNWA